MTYEPVDLYAGAPDGSDLTEYVKANGWDDFLQLGHKDGPLVVKTWRRRTGVGWEYVAEVSDSLYVSEQIKTTNFVDLMDLLAR